MAAALYDHLDCMTGDGPKSFPLNNYERKAFGSFLMRGIRLTAPYEEDLPL